MKLIAISFTGIAIGAASLGSTGAPAQAMSRAAADNYCSGKALDALPPPSIYWVRSQAELAGAEIGDALGRAIILVGVKSACMRKLGYGKKPGKRNYPVGSRPAYRN